MYNYQEQRSYIFTEDGQIEFLKIRDKVKDLLRKFGAVTMEKILHGFTGTNWHHMACVDRLVELGEIKEVDQKKDYVPGQYRIFTNNEQ